MTWRRLIFVIVFVLTFVPLFLLLSCGYFGEAVRLQIERLDHWSKGKR